MFLIMLFLGCQSEADIRQPEPPLSVEAEAEAEGTTTPSERLSNGLGMDVITRGEANPIYGTALPYDNYTIRPVSFQVAEGFRISGALWEPNDEGPRVGAVVAHGHFGEGKSSGEAQGVAHALAMAGFVALAIDTPGVEEGDRPNRQIHFDEGAENRQILEAAGSSAMALQLHGLMAGVDLLESMEGVNKIIVTGASGGAVQAGYLGLLDSRIDAVVMASYVPTPRSSDAGGCLCDSIPGYSGPDGALLKSLTIPNLWISELNPSDTSGVGPQGTALTIEGDHGYNAEMINSAIAWLASVFQLEGVPEITSIPNTPSTMLRSEDVGPMGIADIIQP